MENSHYFESALRAFGDGEMVILTDSEERENEGDLVIAAEYVTPERINFMLKVARGLICVAMKYEYVDKLGLPLHPRINVESDDLTPYFTCSLDLRKGIPTGVSALDRAKTIKALTDANAKISDFSIPGHIQPIKARKGGLFERQGHTEGSIEMAKLVGTLPITVLSEILNDSGTSANKQQLKHLADTYGFHIISIDQLIDHMKR
ncbi:MAG: 3,4-dihydroxy-2-butanone-4-phosphate synthase [Proteobacteria bacterium]|nr:3,4-dihydroxy-2-butanone-4-phosphate synthase [Pseudomonadota bacterium]